MLALVFDWIKRFGNNSSAVLLPRRFAKNGTCFPDYFVQTQSGTITLDLILDVPDQLFNLYPCFQVVLTPTNTRIVIIGRLKDSVKPGTQIT